MPEASLSQRLAATREYFWGGLSRLGWLQMCENHSLMVTERLGNGWGLPRDH
jgi:hypothetical protein